MSGKRVLCSVLAFLCVSGSSAGAEEVNRLGKTSRELVAFFAPKPAATSWVGRYIGATLGWAFGSSTQHYDRAGDHGTATLEPDGPAAAVTLGQNWLVGDGLMLGVEGDLGLLNASQPATPVYDGHVWSSQMGPVYATARGRAGYFVQDDTMLFLTGGLAITTIDDTSIGNTEGETAIKRGLRAGLALGGGVEYQWDPQWTVRAEYMHMDFGTASGHSANDEAFSFEPTLGLWRIGASMKF